MGAAWLRLWGRIVSRTATTPERFQSQGTRLDSSSLVVPFVRVDITAGAPVTVTPDLLVAGYYQLRFIGNPGLTLGAPMNMVSGNILVIELSNISGGAIAAVTLNAVFKVQGGALPLPTNNNHRAVTFHFRSTGNVWNEIARNAADVPN